MFCFDFSVFVFLEIAVFWGVFCSDLYAEFLNVLTWKVLILLLCGMFCQGLLPASVATVLYEDRGTRSESVRDFVPQSPPSSSLVPRSLKPQYPAFGRWERSDLSFLKVAPLLIPAGHSAPQPLSSSSASRLLVPLSYSSPHFVRPSVSQGSLKPSGVWGLRGFGAECPAQSFALRGSSSQLLLLIHFLFAEQSNCSVSSQSIIKSGKQIWQIIKKQKSNFTLKKLRFLNISVKSTK